MSPADDRPPDGDAPREEPRDAAREALRDTGPRELRRSCSPDGPETASSSQFAVGEDESREVEQSPHDPTGLEVARALTAGIMATGRRTGKAARGRPRAGGASRTAMSGAHPDDRDPALLATAMDRLVADSGWQTDVAVHGVFARWASIVGPDVAAHCQPIGFTDGHLTVQADSTAWATQLTLLAPTVVKRLNVELGHDTVRRIDVKSPTGPTWRKGPRSVRGARGPRDTYG